MTRWALLIVTGLGLGTQLAAAALAPAAGAADFGSMGRAMEGQVHSPKGTPLESVQVTLTLGSKKILFKTDGKGRFALPRLVRGKYELLLQKDGFNPVKHSLAVAYDEQEARLTLVMTPVAAGTVEVTAAAPPVVLTNLNLGNLDLAGVADAASMGVITPERLDGRPILRVGEVLETVPGFIVAQHSGGGKANQYFCRGFNIDHGTDFATTVDGIPINLPTHAHGQGYSDANFLIPELIGGIQYWKGPYQAEQGNFTAAGSANINSVQSLAQGIASLEAGDLGYRRELAAGSMGVGKGTLLGAVELYHYDGAWTHPDDYKRVNTLARYSEGDLDNGFAVTSMAYEGKWNATNQMPLRASTEGLIPRFGNLDPTDGGFTHRYALSFDGRVSQDRSFTHLQAYLVDYGVDLFTNFTFFLLDPINGDQILQKDRRTYGGFELSQHWTVDVGDAEVAYVLGIQERNDNIRVGLYHSKDRALLGVDNDNAVDLNALGLYGSTEWRFTPHFRAMLGARVDDQSYRVDALAHPDNSGDGNKLLFSPKAGMAFGPWGSTEFYTNVGQSYHSNDARGVTQRFDDSTGAAVTPSPYLVKALGYELGMRTRPVEGWQTTLSLWGLDMASELVFDGDTGGLVPEGATRRLGFESSNDINPYPWLNLDADFAFSKARFKNPAAGAGDHVPEAIEGVGSMGLALKSEAGHTCNLRLRYFGPRALVQDNSVRSQSSTVLQAGVGYQASKHVRLQLEGMNVLNAKVNDIEYYYATRLQGEPAAGVNDRLVHPADPRSFRFATIVKF